LIRLYCIEIHDELRPCTEKRFSQAKMDSFPGHHEPLLVASVTVHQPCVFLAKIWRYLVIWILNLSLYKVFYLISFWIFFFRRQVLMTDSLLCWKYGMTMQIAPRPCWKGWGTQKRPEKRISRSLFCQPSLNNNTSSAYLLGSPLSVWSASFC